MDRDNRRKLYNIIERDEGKSDASRLYDIFMFYCIIFSLLPLVFRRAEIEQYPILEYIEWATVLVFIFDYILRFITEDFRQNKVGSLEAFLEYPITKYAIVDLLSILPTLLELCPSFKVFRVIRLLKLLRIFKFVKYSKSLRLFVDAWDNCKDTLGTVAMLAGCYILISAMVIYNVEPEKQFPTFFQALYWATISLTTVGYGDIYPITEWGKFVSMISSLVGCAVIALPSGIITAGYIKALEEEKSNKDKNTLK